MHLTLPKVSDNGQITLPNVAVNKADLVPNGKKLICKRGIVVRNKRLIIAICKIVPKKSGARTIDCTMN